MSYSEPVSHSNSLADPVHVRYQIALQHTHTKERWIEAKSLISEDVKRSQPVYVSLEIVHSKNAWKETLIPTTPTQSFLSLLENPEVLNLKHSSISNQIDEKGGGQSFNPINKLVSRGNTSVEFTLSNQETSYFTFLSSNNWTELVDMKVYLLILLLILITSDLLFILHIIKI